MALEIPPDILQGRRLAVPHGDDVVLPKEDVDLAELDPLLLVQVARRSEHHEKRLAVVVQPGTVMRLDGIMHGFLGQAELTGDRESRARSEEHTSELQSRQY